MELNSAILGSEIFLLVVDAQLSRDGTPLALTGPIVTGTTFTYSTQLNSFGRSDFGNYTCRATVRPQPTSTYLIGVDVLSDTLSIKAGNNKHTVHGNSLHNEYTINQKSMAVVALVRNKCMELVTLN